MKSIFTMLGLALCAILAGCSARSQSVSAGMLGKPAVQDCCCPEACETCVCDSCGEPCGDNCICRCAGNECVIACGNCGAQCEACCGDDCRDCCTQRAATAS